MKRTMIFLFVAALLSASALQAQNAFGVKGAFNMANMTIKSGGDKLETQMIPAFNLGAYYDLGLADEFFLRPEVLFSAKGAKDKDSDGTFHVSYLEIPVSFLYKGDLSGGKVLVGVGPYMGIGLGGKVKYDGGDQTIKFKNDVSETDISTDFYLKRLDFGGKVYAGYELRAGLSFAIEATLGLANIEPKYSGESSSDNSIKNVGFGVSVGYKIK